MNVELINCPVLKFNPNVWDDITTIIELSDKEVGWLGHVVRDGNTYVVDAVYVPKQEVESATAEISPEGQIQCLSETGWDGIHLWGHSHVHMPANPSGQDNTQFRALCRNTEFFVRQIGNKDGNHHLSIYDESRGIIVEGLPHTIDIDDEVYKHWSDMLKKNVSVKERAVNLQGFNGHGYRWPNDALPAIYQNMGVGQPSPESKAEHDKNVGRLTKKEKKALKNFHKNAVVGNGIINPYEYRWEEIVGD